MHLWGMHPTPAPENDLALRRAVWPELLFAPDVALALGLRTASAARRAILAGRLGPHVRIGRRLAVRRDSVVAHLRAQERRTGGGS